MDVPKLQQVEPPQELRPLIEGRKKGQLHQRLGKLSKPQSTISSIVLAVSWTWNGMTFGQSAFRIGTQFGVVYEYCFGSLKRGNPPKLNLPRCIQLLREDETLIMTNGFQPFEMSVLSAESTVAWHCQEIKRRNQSANIAYSEDIMQCTF